MGGCIHGLRPSRRPPCGLLRMRKSLMALKKLLILRKLPTGPRFARPEDRLRGCLKGRTAPIRQICNSFTRSKVGIEAPRLAAVAPCSSQGRL